ncbi:MAG: hypothetical protein ACFB5Z_12405 [Elainellaceae cyanobacterium]
MNTFSTSRSHRRGFTQWTSLFGLAAAAIIVADYQPPEQQLPPTDYPPTTASQPVNLPLS